MVGLRRIPVLPFALAVAAGVLAALYGTIPSGILEITGAGFFVLAGIAVWRTGASVLSWVLVGLFFVAFGAWRAIEHVDRETRTRLDRFAGSGKPVTLYGTVQSTTCRSDEGSVLLTRVVLHRESDLVAAGSLRVRLIADSGAVHTLRVGDGVAAIGQFHPASESYQLTDAAVIYSVAQRLAGTFRVKSNGLIREARGGHVALRTIERIRSAILRTFSDLLNPDAAALCSALVLGERGDFSGEFSNRLRLTGLSHVFALSGMNVALLAGLLWYSLGFCYLPRMARLWIVLGFILAYMELGREAPSLVRASIMAGLFVLGQILYRRAEIGNCVAGAAFIELLLRPLDLIDAGFLLSYMAVIGLMGATIFLYQTIRACWPMRETPLVRSITTLLAGSLAAQIGTMPITAWLFQRIPLLGIFGNLIAIPAFAILLVWSIVLPIVGAVAPTVAPVVAGSIEGLTFLLGKFVELLATIPLAGWSLPALHPAAAVGMFCAAAALMTGFYQARKLLISLSALALLNFVVWSAIFAPAQPKLTTVFFSVENGDATLISDRCGHHLLVDTGPGYGDWSAAERILPYLRAHDIEKLDALVLTHPDNDHIGGAAELLQAIAIERVFYNGDSGSTRTFVETALIAAQMTPGMTAIARGSRISLSPECTLDILSPDQWTQEEAIPENRRSLVMRLHCQSTSLLLTADIDSVVEQQLLSADAPLRSDILKVGHHGSKASTCDGFLDRVQPSVAILSYGRHNRYGHPSATIVERLERRNVDVHHTAREGIIVATSDGRTWTMEETRARRLIRLWNLPNA
jgi:competence protein ComEC